MGDETAKGMNSSLSRVLTTHHIESVLKPGARLNSVMESLDKLTQSFDLSDYVIIKAGSNDFRNGKPPSFKAILNKLRQCTHTNIIFFSVREQGRYLKQIQKFNDCLQRFVHRYDSCCEGSVFYVEPDTKYTHGNNECIGAIVNLMNSKRSKNLVFIHPCNYKLSNTSDENSHSDIFL